MAAAALDSAPTETVKGREPTAASVTIQNLTAPGKNPAQEDELEATYQYQDPDGDLEDTPQTRLQWAAAGANISGATTSRFTPTAEQNKQFLTVGVAPASQAPADPNVASAPAVSPDSGGPVLPPRAQLASEYMIPGSSKRWGDAYMHCANVGARLPSVSELQTMFTTYTRANAVGEDSQRDLETTYGHNLDWVVWASEANSEDQHRYVYMMEDGRAANNSNANYYPFVCALGGATEDLPEVTGVSIPDAPVIGTPVTAQYTYVGNPTIPDRSRFQWYRATSADGNTNRTLISGATANSYTPTAEDVDKWLVVEVTPASYDTVMGTPDTAVSTVAVPPIEQPFPPNTKLVPRSGHHEWGIDSGFPSKAFENATFTIWVNGNNSTNDEYEWSEGPSSEGYVTTLGEVHMSGKTITVRARRPGEATQFVKTFTASSWYTNSGTTPLDWMAADEYCRQRGATLAPSGNVSTGVPGAIGIGTLMGEWGGLGSYGGSGFMGGSYYWLADQFSGGHRAVNSNDGTIIVESDENYNYAMCAD